MLEAWYPTRSVRWIAPPSRTTGGTLPDAIGFAAIGYCREIGRGPFPRVLVEGVVRTPPWLHGQISLIGCVEERRNQFGAVSARRCWNCETIKRGSDISSLGALRISFWRESRRGRWQLLSDSCIRSALVRGWSCRGHNPTETIGIRYNISITQARSHKKYCEIDVSLCRYHRSSA